MGRPAYREPMYETPGCYRFTDEHLDTILGGPFPDHEDLFRPENGNRDIGAGSWILIREVPHIMAEARPEPASVYYAVPALYDSSIGYRKDGRYLIVIKVQSESGRIHDVYLYTNEYIVCNDEIMEALKEEDLLETMMYSNLEQVDSKLNDKTVKEYAVKYKELPEEDRNILDAYMVDGLSFDQACSMYFTQRYSDLRGSVIWFKAKPALRYLFWD